MTETHLPHFLIWPDEWPQHTVQVDLEKPARFFHFVRPGDPNSWRKLYGLRRDTLILDPDCRAWGELSALIRARGYRHVEGLSACLEAISLEGASHG